MSIKLTPEQIKEIPELRKTMDNKKIAEHFGVSIYTVGYWIQALKKKGYEITPIKKGRKSRI